MKTLIRLPIIPALFLILSCPWLAPAQTCETFDNFIVCGSNLFDCLPDSGCAGAFTSAGWVNQIGDDIDWSVTDSATPSLSTGPLTDHTTGAGKYLFTESSLCYNQTAVLLTRVYNLSGIANPELQFWYHMFGADMGSLSVEIESPSGSGAWSPLWNKSGNQGNKWYLAIASLSAHANNSVRFRFTGVTGAAFESDIALDDVCVAAGCFLNCNDANACTEDLCYNGNCLNQSKDCDDGDPCTEDVCTNGTCSNDELNCDDGDGCTFDYCQSGICFSDPPCEDFDDCTIDSCDGAGNCIYIEVSCEDDDLCTIDYCQFGVCVNESQCDDGDDCTIDSCDAQSNCINTPIVCNDGFACTDDSCISGVCAFVSLCSDNDPCTADQCVGSNCSYTAAPSCLCREPGKTVGLADDLITDSIVVSNQPGVISDLNISVDISHAYISDLIIALVSPQGTTALLFNNGCFDEDNLQAVYDDEGSIPDCPVSEFRHVFSFAPLSVFDGEPLNGTWVIRITDTYPLEDDGLLNQWCMLPTVPGCSGNLQCDDSNTCTDDVCDNGTCVHAPNSNCSVTVSGKILTETGVPVPTATVQLTGTSADSYITYSDGEYQFTVAQGGDYTVAPSKTNDQTTNNGITTLDLLFIRSHVLANSELSSPYKIIAADVNGSNSVSTGDIVLIRSVILQTNQSFLGKLWNFVPHDMVFDTSLAFPSYQSYRIYEDISEAETDQDFIALKLGDVNNSWDPNIAKLAVVGTIRLSMDEQQAFQGEEIVVPVKARDFINVTGYQFTLSWDAGMLNLTGVENRALQGYYGMHRISEGYLTTSWDDETLRGVSLRDDETLFELKFKTPAITGTTVITIGSDVTASEAYNENFELLNILAQSGTVKIGDISAVSQSALSSYHLQVRPNPFSNAAQIIFELTGNEEGVVCIYDLLGKEVKRFTVGHAKGKQSLEWNGRDKHGNELGSGLYHIKLLAGDFYENARVILIR